ncbi:hypothetical protein Nepgr_005547 [Nepenthes gracilis]|uniref:Phytocyanin domain-containing protein n=1 Tax=Nepenthes gracilis TaxID=150966 RepID=A0AAD3S3C5_NEPGR|nr:hypothetical protein Nepgr_005547 [Nepenthes gracilis]
MGFSATSFPMFTAVLLAVVAMETAVVEALKEFNVGEREGWRVPTADNSNMYNDWAQTKRFHVGDSLRFQYQNDSVLVVDKYGYYHCNIENPISSYSDGNTMITLDQAGPIYFISGDRDHCKNGQRLIVDVMSPHQQQGAAPPDSDLSTSPGPTSSGSGAVVPAASTLLPFVLLCAASVFL